jgi:hypothetical protein
MLTPCGSNDKCIGLMHKTLRHKWEHSKEEGGICLNFKIKESLEGEKIRV